MTRRRLSEAILLWLVVQVAGSKTKPEQLHLAFAGRDSHGAPTGMRVAWFTSKLAENSTHVRYGTESGKLTSLASSTNVKNYLADYGYHHMVEVTGLLPSTKYFYSVGGDAGGWSEEWSWTTPPSGATAHDASISMAVFGDWGFEDSKQRPQLIHMDGLEKHWSASFTRSRLETMKDQFDAVWNVGDIAYADDAFGHDPIFLRYEAVYNGFMNWIQNLSATRPYMVSPGNHESECHSLVCLLSHKGIELSNFTAFNTRWHMPAAESGGRDGSSMWYSWNWGPVHFVSINTETDWPGAEERDTGDSHDKHLPAGHFGQPGEYLEWLEADLSAAAQARRSGAGPRWIIAGGHRPFKAIHGDHTRLFQKYGVDVYFAGHTHSYARAGPVNGTLYVTVGGAGCDEMAYPKDSAGNYVCNGTTPVGERQGSCKDVGPPDSVSVESDHFAFGILKADANTLQWELIDSVNGTVIDRISLPSGAHDQTAWV